MTDVFERRLRRAETLEKEWPFAAEVLRFFGAVTRYQQHAFGRFSASPSPKTGDLYPLVPALLDVVEREGPAELARRAASAAGPEAFKPGLLECVSGKRPEDPGLAFLLATLLQPFLIAFRKGKGSAPVPSDETQQICPACKHLPGVGLLREDKSADTVRRTLVCSLCSLEWDFPRVLCPGCKEENPEKLPRLTAQEIPWIRVEACDACRTYLKSIDLTKNPDADPWVDELGSTPLDVIAREQGYVKIAPNLAGL